jgi:hypothetical protein
MTSEVPSSHAVMRPHLHRVASSLDAAAATAD